MEAVQAETVGLRVLRKGDSTCTGKKSEEPNKKRTNRGKNNLLYLFKPSREKKKKEKISPKIREIRREKNNNTNRRAQLLQKANDVCSSRNWHNPCVCLHARRCGQENIFEELVMLQCFQMAS